MKEKLCILALVSGFNSLVSSSRSSSSFSPKAFKSFPYR